MSYYRRRRTPRVIKILRAMLILCVGAIIVVTIKALDEAIDKEEQKAPAKVENVRVEIVPPPCPEPVMEEDPEAWKELVE